ncbi:hypothetical protein TNIN_98921 [Trichonephila inaurata madagascariensis]|uniref:Uncharacterized protein n=1 Tax=Trichonephila inaurata madagascariensis TaxID=2747483 RepID=A0A8X6WU19_9ARAC|nr:hypothetical protein TNIN_98921 [Trichonephila inaurata madagascariensis]
MNSSYEKSWNASLRGIPLTHLINHLWSQLIKNELLLNFWLSQVANSKDRRCLMRLAHGEIVSWLHRQSQCKSADLRMRNWIFKSPWAKPVVNVIKVLTVNVAELGN